MRRPRSRYSPNARLRALAIVALVALGAPVGAALGVACLPDLAPFTVAQGSDIDGNASFTGCGDGIIATLDDGGDAGESCDPGRVDAGVGADVPGCKACQVTCEGQLDPLTNHCYFVVGSDPMISAAQGHCASVGAHLVTFASRREADLVAALPGADGPNGYWVGLSRRQDFYGSDHAEEPGYPVPPLGPCSGCFGLGAVDGGDAGGTFPLEDGSTMTEPCLVSHGGAWFQSSCRGEPDQLAPATICEREPVGLRIAGCIGVYCMTVPFTAGRKTYVLVPQTVGPDQAAQSCVTLGGSLVVLETAEEREELAHEIGQQFADPSGPQVELQIWVGVTNDGGVWTWEDGQPLDGARPSPWGNAQPSGDLPGDRGYLKLTSPTYDVQLAYSDQRMNVARFYACQRTP